MMTQLSEVLDWRGGTHTDCDRLSRRNHVYGVSTWLRVALSRAAGLMHACLPAAGIAG